MIAIGALAYGVVAWVHLLHASGVSGGLSSHLAHILRDGTLALPLATIAWLAGRSLGRRALPFAAALTFSLLLIPGAAAHRLLEAGGHAHGAATIAFASHDVTDAARALPAALLLAVLVLRPRAERRPPRRAPAIALAMTAFLSLLPARAGAEIIAFAAPLPIPPVLTGSDITLRMEQTDVQILPGAKTTMWTYGGVFPGPTIRRPSGTPTRLTFVNDLPAEAGSTTVHHHGEHAASSEDGQPHAELIPTGGSRTYTYDFMEDGAPERAAFQWYHDHRMDVTGRNVWKGLAGMVILDDPVDAALPLPSGEYDVPLMIADRTFDAGNQIPYTFDLSGARGTHVLVNGAVQPFLSVADRRYRLRLLNASNERSYEFDLGNGASFQQIATESGLLPVPVTRTRLRLGPAERAEIVVDLAGRLGQQIVLRNRVGTDGTAQVMQFRVETHVATDPSSVPGTLRAAPSIAWAPPSLTRTWTLGQTPDLWTINGAGYDPNRVDTAPLNPRLNTTERWVFTNASTVDHLVHIHDVDWKIVSRTSRFATDPAETLAEQGLKETFLVRPQEVVQVDSRFTDHLGRYVLHCHILEHEDRAMMAQFEVVA